MRLFTSQYRQDTGGEGLEINTQTGSNPDCIPDLLTIRKHTFYVWLSGDRPSNCHFLGCARRMINCNKSLGPCEMVEGGRGQFSRMRGELKVV